MSGSWVRRVLAGVGVWILVLAVVRVVVVPAEHCRPVTEAQLLQSAELGVGWLADNQEPDGRWLYRYHRGDNEDLGGYNLVRHAGLLVSLYQADAAGIEGARSVGDAGTAFVEKNLVETGDGGRSFGPATGTQKAGGAALAVAGLVERREHTGDTSYDDLLQAFGTFLAGQVQPNGAVLGDWSPDTGAPVPGTFSKFYTGEVFWALTRLHSAFPSGGWDDPALRVMRYLAEERDEVEGWWPTIPDHWAAYGLAEVARWPDGSAVTDSARDYAHHQAELQSAQIRYESQRTNSFISHYTRGRQTLGAGLGTIGEGFNSLWRLAERDPDLEIDRQSLRERTLCTASVLVERQVDDAQADGFPDPDRTRGAWFQFDVTQMDDQQHSISAVIGAIAVVRDEVPT